MSKYRYPVVRGDLQRRVREIIRQTFFELGIGIIKDVLSKSHVHVFIAAPQHAISDVMRRIKGRSPKRTQQEFLAADAIRKC